VGLGIQESKIPGPSQPASIALPKAQPRTPRGSGSLGNLPLPARRSQVGQWSTPPLARRSAGGYSDMQPATWRSRGHHWSPQVL